MKRQPFNVEVEIQKAWDWCWKHFCEPTEYRDEIYDKDGMPTGEFEKETRTIQPRQSWLSASDIERRVRAAAAEQLEGKEPGTYGADAWGHRLQISCGPGGLLGAVRDWLSTQIARGILTGHNFGRGHCSGMRCRPVSVPLTAAETKTIAQREKRIKGETPVHFSDPEVNRYPGKSLCSRKARETNKAKSRGYFSRGYGRSNTRLSSEPAKVTCPRCLKLLAAQSASVS